MVCLTYLLTALCVSGVTSTSILYNAHAKISLFEASTTSTSPISELTTAECGAEKKSRDISLPLETCMWKQRSRSILLFNNELYRQPDFPIRRRECGH